MSCEDRMLIDNYEVNSGRRPLRSTVFGRLYRAWTQLPAEWGRLQAFAIHH